MQRRGSECWNSAHKLADKLERPRHAISLRCLYSDNQLSTQNWPFIFFARISILNEFVFFTWLTSPVLFHLFSFSNTIEWTFFLLAEIFPQSSVQNVNHWPRSKMKIPGARKFIMLKIASFVLPIAAHRFRSIFFCAGYE